MDCHNTLEMLDCIRPNSADLELPEFADARAHVESCESCQREFASRQEFDHAIAAVVRDVEVPESLRAELLNAVLQEAGGEPLTDLEDTLVEPADHATESADRRTRKTSSSRRTWWLAAASVACGIAVGIGALLWNPGQQQFSVAELQQLIDIQPANPEPFDESFVFQLPLEWSDSRLHLGAELQGQNLDEESGHEVGRLQFSLTRSRREPVSGIIVAVPASRVNPLPGALSMSRAIVTYLPNNVAALAWHEGDLVYVVLIHGNASGLEELQRRLSGRAA